MYEELNENAILRLVDNACIPKDNNNRDYIQYLKWLEEGNKGEIYDSNSSNN